jgi:hypothetical protein
MEEIYERFRDRVEFFVVYVQEAHPTDGWQTESNIEEGVLFRQHQSYDEREEVAHTCSLDLHITIPVLVEEMDNAIDEAYGAAPERLYLSALTEKWPIKEALAPTSSTWTSGSRLSRLVWRSRRVTGSGLLSPGSFS